MLYWLTQQFTGRIGGLHVFSYLTFAAILATASALGLSLLVGPPLISRLSRATRSGRWCATTARPPTC